MYACWLQWPIRTFLRRVAILATENDWAHWYRTGDRIKRETALWQRRNDRYEVILFRFQAIGIIHCAIVVGFLLFNATVFDFVQRGRLYAMFTFVQIEHAQRLMMLLLHLPGR